MRMTHYLYIYVYKYMYIYVYIKAMLFINQMVKRWYFKAYDLGLQVIVIEDELSQVACPITTKLVLDQDPVTKEPLVQVHRNLVTRLKPHQVDG